MSERNLDQLLSGAVDAVLETMFFSASMGPAEPETGAGVLEACLAFREDMLTDAQPGRVVCELANMLCGSLVSKLEDQESFALDTPELAPAGSETSGGSQAVPTARQSFELENGILTITLHLDEAA